MKLLPPRLTDHGGEVALLGWLGTGVLLILLVAAGKGQLSGSAGVDVAAFLLVLQRIVEAVQKRWEQRGSDRMADKLASSAPTPDQVDKTTVEGTPS